MKTTSIGLLRVVTPGEGIEANLPPRVDFYKQVL